MNLSDEEWAKLCPYLPDYVGSPKGGRPRLKQKKVLEGILYVFKNNISWKEVPKEFGSGSALNNYFRDWARSGVFHQLNTNHQLQFTYLDWEKIKSLNEDQTTGD